MRNISCILRLHGFVNRNGELFSADFDCSARLSDDQASKFASWCWGSGYKFLIGSSVVSVASVIADVSCLSISGFS